MKKNPIIEFLSSAKLLISLLVVIACVSVIGTVIPQLEPPEDYISRYGEPLYRLLKSASLLNLYRSWWYISLLALLCINIIACTLVKFTLKPRGAGTIVVHLSVVVILAGATIGAIFGEKGFMKISEHETLDTFYTRQDAPVRFGFALHLEDFHIDWYEPPHFVIFVQAKDGSVRTLEFEKTGEAKALEEINSSIALLRYLPDFSMDMATHEVTSKTGQPNNPALELILKDAQGEHNLWLFEKFPGFGQEGIPVKLAFRREQGRVKDYKSALRVIEADKEVMRKTIEVNSPLTYKGYTFYQSGYDPRDLSWSGLQVAKDPGVPVVYAGFIFLITGLSFVYFVKPYMK